MHPGNNFIISMFTHRWGTIIIMVIIMIIMTQISFNFPIVITAIAATIGQQFIVLSDDKGAIRRYTNLLMVITMTFYAVFIPYKLMSYDGHTDRYEDVNTTGFSHFYKDTGDGSNNLYFVEPGSREVSFTIPMGDADAKRYLGGIEPQLRKHITNDIWFQYNDVDYDILLGGKDAK